MANSVVLQGCFQLSPRKTFYEVRLTREKLTFEETTFGGCCQARAKPQSVVELRDIYGAKVFKSRQPNDDAAYIHLFSCPLKGKKRVRTKLAFKVSGWESLEANVKLAEKWVTTLLWIVREPSLDLDIIQEKKNLPPFRKLLVFLNPCSGKGKSLKIFQKKVAPMFEDADIDYKLIITEYAGHAKIIASQLDVREWDGIVICSGDGLVYELINGLMNRPDWEEAIKIPIGVIPTGSGNGLCCSSLFASGEPYEVTSAIYAVIRGNHYDLDIATIITPTHKIYSFMLMGWGLISDVDIESEKYRYLGHARFTVGTLVRVLDLRSYRGKLSYLPFDNDEEEKGMTSSIDVPIMKPLESEELFESPKDTESFKSPSGSFYSMPGSPPEERHARDMVSSCDNPGMLNSERPSINSLPGNSLHGSGLPGNVVANSGSELLSEGPSMSDAHLFGPSTHLLPALMDPLPCSWKTVEGEFILGSAIMVTHLAPDLLSCPFAKFGDGATYIMYAKTGVSRMQVLNLFIKMEDGSYVNSEEVVCVKARAFRLEPDMSQMGTLAIDGEPIPYSAIQGQIHKGLGKVMCV